MRKSLGAARPAPGFFLFFLITASQLALLAGCGGHSTTPLAPSASAAPASSGAPEPAAARATITGTVASSSSSPALETTLDVTLNGSIATLGGTCPALSLSVEGTPVKTNSATVFSNRACAELRSGDAVYVLGPKQGDGSVLASRLYYVLPRASGPIQVPMPVQVSVSGEISGFTGTCPAVSVTINGTLAQATSATTFFGTKGCSGLQDGDAVSVAGTKQDDGSVLVSSFAYTGPAPVADTTLNGPVVGLSGTCPALTLAVAGTAVKTNSATVFNNKPCAELRKSDTVYAIGPKQSDGSVLASRIYFVAPTTVEVTVSGAISGFTGTCLYVSMTVSGTLVKAGTSTTFVGTKGCSGLRNGDAVTVAGTRQSDGSLLAIRITYTGPAPVVDTTLNGPAVGLTGTCPALTLSVAGTAVKTNSATVFNNKPCAELRNSDTVYAIGPKQSDGSVLASRMYYVAPTAVEVTVSGAISGFTGTCLSVSMTVSGTVVKANSATTFSGAKGCSVLQNGDAVTAVGTKQSDGSVLATRVTYTGPAPVADTTLNGPVVSLGGTCPALSMTVAGTPVRTNSATVFNNKPCAELKNSDTIYVIGPKQSDGSVLASRVYYVVPTNAPTPTPTPATVTGTITALAGTCPALSMKLNNETYVRTTSATTFTGRPCAEIKAGDTSQAIGPRQWDGVILAGQLYVSPGVVK